MALDVTSYSNIMKTDYHGPIVDALENSTFFLSKIERMEVDTGGNFFHVPIRSGRVGSIGARLDHATEALPVGLQPSYSAATFSVKSLYATFRLSGRSMRASRADKFAYAKAQVEEMERTTIDLKKDTNRQIFGGGSAELCQAVSAAVSGTTQTITVSNNLYPNNPTKFLGVGLPIDIRTISTGATVTGGDNVSIVSVPSTTTFVVDNATTIVVANTAIYRQGNVGTNSAGTYKIKEIMGLFGAIDNRNPSALWSGITRLTDNFGAIDRSAAAGTFWQSTRNHNSGVNRQLSLNLLETGIDDAEIAAGGVISIIQTNHAIYRLYGLLRATAKQANEGEMELDGGWKALSVNGIPMFKDTECPDNTIFLIDERYWALAVQGPWTWLEEEGGAILKRIAGYDQYEGVMARECELVCRHPRANCKIMDVAHS